MNKTRHFNKNAFQNDAIFPTQFYVKLEQIYPRYCKIAWGSFVSNLIGVANDARKW